MRNLGGIAAGGRVGFRFPRAWVGADGRVVVRARPCRFPIHLSTHVRRDHGDVPLDAAVDGTATAAVGVVRRHGGFRGIGCRAAHGPGRGPAIRGRGQAHHPGRDRPPRQRPLGARQSDVGQEGCSRPAKPHRRHRLADLRSPATVRQVGCPTARHAAVGAAPDAIIQPEIGRSTGLTSPDAGASGPTARIDSDSHRTRDVVVLGDGLAAADGCGSAAMPFNVVER